MPLPVNTCLLKHPHPEHDWWYTSEGGGHMIATPDDADPRASVKQHHCPGVDGIVPPPVPERSTMNNLYRAAVEASKAGTTWVCPRCDHPTADYPAVSRKDNQTPVCPRCGTEEAVRQHQGYDVWPPTPWPFLGTETGGSQR
jgi:hypothetical protein